MWCITVEKSPEMTLVVVWAVSHVTWIEMVESPEMGWVDIWAINQYSEQVESTEITLVVAWASFILWPVSKGRVWFLVELFFCCCNVMWEYEVMSVRIPNDVNFHLTCYIRLMGVITTQLPVVGALQTWALLCAVVNGDLLNVWAPAHHSSPSGMEA